MILSRSSEYAIRLIFYLFEKQHLPGYVRIKDAATDLQVPYYQLAKVANLMISKKILISHTGPTGGIDLTNDADCLCLSDILRAFGDGEVFESCVLGLPECSSEKPCPIHSVWSKAKVEILEIFRPYILPLDGQLEKNSLPKYLRDDCPPDSFTWKDLEGKTIKRYRIIGNPRGENPKDYGLLIFDHDTIVLTEVLGNGGDARIYSLGQ